MFVLHGQKISASMQQTMLPNVQKKSSCKVAKFSVIATTAEPYYS